MLVTHKKVSGMAFATKEFKNIFGELVDLSKAADVYGLVDQTMSLNGWVLIVFEDGKMVSADYYCGKLRGEGYLLRKESVLKTCERGIDLERVTKCEINSELGERFEGQQINGVPYGEGILYDSNGTAVYSGIVINWKREGYGVSYYPNGALEYAGTWCNNNRQGYGNLYSTNGQLVCSSEWVNGKEVKGEYEGDGSDLHTRVKTLSIASKCIFTKFRVDNFSLLEELLIGEGTFSEAPSFRIRNMKHLRSIRVCEQAFTNDSVDTSPNRSFSVTNCPVLSVIDIAPNCFGDFGGDFVLKDLPQLEKLLIGRIGGSSISFLSCSFVVRGRSALLFQSVDLPNLQEIVLGKRTFQHSMTTVIESDFPFPL